MRFTRDALVRRPGPAQQIGVQIDRNDKLRAHGPADGNRQGIDQGAVDQPALVEFHGREDARQRNRRAQRIDEISLAQPDFMARHQIRGNAGVRHRQIFDGKRAHMPAHHGHQAIAADHAAAHHSEIEIGHDSQPGQRARPALQYIQLAGQMNAANQCANRGAADDVGANAGPIQRTQHADMGPAARDARAQGEADARQPHCSAASAMTGNIDPPGFSHAPNLARILYRDHAAPMRT